MRHWDNGRVDQSMLEKIAWCDVMEIHDNQNKLLLNSSMFGYGKGEGYPVHRGQMAMVLYEYAKELGIEFRLGHRVTDYFEDDDEAGVIIDGERITGDCVIGADGVHSKVRGKVIGFDPTPHSSGYAIYRAYFDGDEMRADPETRWVTESKVSLDTSKIFIGPDCHLMAGTGRKGKDCFFMCTHKVS